MRVRIAVLTVLAILALVVGWQTFGQEPSAGPNPVPVSPGGASGTTPATSVPTSGITAPALPPRPPGFVRPEDYGAVGDGRHDDTAAIQAALDDARGRVVHLSDDTTYLCRKALLLPSRSTLAGSRTATLRFTWEHRDGASSGGGFYIGNADQESGNNDIRLRGFSLVGAADGKPAGPQYLSPLGNFPAIRLRQVKHFALQGLEVSRSPGISILYQGSSHGRIIDNYVHDSGRDGITGTWHKQNLHDILVARNQITRVGDDAIAVIGTPRDMVNRSELPTDIDIVGNTVDGWHKNVNGLMLGRGVALVAVTHVRVLSNTIANTLSYGIFVRGEASVQPTGMNWTSQHITLVGNTISYAGRNALDSVFPPQYYGGNGIDIHDATDVVANNNVVLGSLDRDLAVGDCKSCQIQ